MKDNSIMLAIIKLKLNYKFSTIPIKLPVVFIVDIDKMNLKLWKCKEPKIAMINFKKNKTGGLILSNLKTYEKTIRKCDTGVSIDI